jgi:hypothetical protein
MSTVIDTKATIIASSRHAATGILAAFWLPSICYPVSAAAQQKFCQYALCAKLLSLLSLPFLLLSCLDSTIARLIAKSASCTPT